MVIAMSIAKWYFTRNKSYTGNLTVLSSFWSTGRYHIGTLAFGSLILAIVQFIRAVLAKIQEKVKKANSAIADCLLCCCQCCLWCFEQCIKFMNKNAYIQTAIWGTPFCTSAREAFFLILRNFARIGSVSYVSGAVLIIGKLFISSATTALSYYMMSQHLGDELLNLWGPTLLVFLISYFVSDMFLAVFDMGISTVLQCFIADEEMFDGDQCFAEGSLKRWLDNYE
jgi:Plasma-membrane choline transporter